MSATQEQIDMLLDFLQAHQGFHKNVMKNSDGRRLQKNQLWANITAKLNNVGGAVKTVRQWQKVWADRKYLAKRAAAVHRRSAVGNSSPSTPPPLTDTERRVIKILGEDLDTRQTQDNIPAPGQTCLGDQNTDNGSCDESIKYDKDLVILTKDPLVAECKSEVGAKTPGDRRSRRNFSQSPRCDSDMETQLVHLEEKKIEELTGIRQELRELTDVVRQLIEVIHKKS